MILSVGYRVHSKRGIAFRKWANNVLKQYIIKGYAINERRLLALEKTVDIQSRMLADALDIEESDVLRAVMNIQKHCFCLINMITRHYVNQMGAVQYIVLPMKKVFRWSEIHAGSFEK